MNKVIAIIQARLGSSRLNKKVLLNLEGKTMLEHIVIRVSKSKYIEKVILATTSSSSDDPLAKFASEELNLPVVRGDEENVLKRFYEASQEFPSEYIVRITADDPLKDAQIIDLCIEELLKNPMLDYCSNTLEPTYPEGLDVEVFKTEALIKTYNEAQLISEKEHVTPYIWKNRDKFNLKNIRYEENLSDWRWTVDKPEDFKFMEIIFKEFKNNGSDFSYKDVIKYVKANPNLLEINNNTIRNEGYIKSIKEEA